MPDPHESLKNRIHLHTCRALGNNQRLYKHKQQPSLMPHKHFIVLNSRIAFLGLSTASLVLPILMLLLVHKRNEDGYFLVLYLLLAAAYIYGLWRSTKTVKIIDDELEISMLFGLARTRRIPLAQLAQIAVKAKSKHVLHHIELKFQDGTQVCLHASLSNFREAYFFLDKYYKDVPRISLPGPVSPV